MTKNCFTSLLRHGSRSLCVFAFLAGAFLLCTFIACGSDSDGGDERPADEVVKEELMGTWTLSSSQQPTNASTAARKVFGSWRRGTVIRFYSNNTYTDSSDGGTTRHRWTSKATGYYKTVLNLDGQNFTATGHSTSGGKWDGMSVEWTPDADGSDGDKGGGGGKWDFDKKKGPDSEQDPDDKPEEPEKHCACDYIDPYPREIPVYDGNTPPNIEGVYLMSPYTVVYCSDGYYQRGVNLSEQDYIRFSNQNASKNTLDYTNNAFVNNSLYGQETGNGAFISGSGNNFTVFFNTTAQSSDGVRLTTVTLISGTKTSSGIANLYYMTYLTNKIGDTAENYMKVGTYRIFKDGDGNSPLTQWRTRGGQVEQPAESLMLKHLTNE